MAVKVPMWRDGTAVKIKSQRGWPCQCGKQLYYAPETLNPGSTAPAFDPLKIDMWGVGVVLFIVLTGLPPWDVVKGPSFEDVRFKHVVQGRIVKLLAAWGVPKISSGAVEVLHALLALNPIDRPSIAELRNFRWYVEQGRCSSPPTSEL